MTTVFSGHDSAAGWILPDPGAMDCTRPVAAYGAQVGVPSLFGFPVWANRVSSGS